ncbi:MAG: PQQ-binding-like beta-propeller repeat protein [Candidatus Micrarchaeaceae archaeon]
MADPYQYDGGVNHTYYVNVTLNPINLSIGQAIIGTPTLYSGDIIVTTAGNLSYLDKFEYDKTKGSVIDINISTGKVLWRVNFPDQILTQPIVYNKMVFVGMGNSADVPNNTDRNGLDGIYAINLSDGQVNWGITTLGPDMTTPAIYDGLLIYPNIGYFYVINATTGLVERGFPTNLPDTLSSPLIYNGNAYFGAGYVNTSNSIIYPDTIHRFSFFDYNISTGSISWQDNFSIAGGGLNDACPVAFKNIIITAYLYNSTYKDPVIVALNRLNGSIEWSINETAIADKINVVEPPIPNSGYNFTENSISPMVLYNGTVLSDSNYLGVMLAINATNGKVLWAFNTGQNEGAPNVIYGKYVIDINDGGDLFILNIRNGTLVKEIQTNIPHLSAQPIITKNYAVIAGLNGEILYFNLKNITGS